MKVNKSNINISPYGGVVPIFKQLKKVGLPELVRSSFDTRVKQARYGHDDTIMNWIMTSLTGGTRLDHITKLRKKLSIIPDLKIMSDETLGRGLKALTTETLIHRSITQSREPEIVFTNYNDNIPMNRLLVKSSKLVGALKENVSYTMDMDATFVRTERRGAVRKKNENGKIDVGKIGFNLMTCLIEDKPVFVSTRDGYSNAKFQLPECLKNSLTLLEESNIKIGRFISDAAGYNKEVIEMLESKGIKFNMRFPFHKGFDLKLKKCDSWRKTEIETANHFWNCEIADIPYKMYDRPGTKKVSKTIRVVAIRMVTDKTLEEINPKEWKRINDVKIKMNELSQKNALKDEIRANKDNHWKKIDGYLYKLFVTNDFDATSEQIVLEYNNRGNAERKFSFLKQDSGWRIPPFMSMEANAVFFIVAALANNVFRAMATLFQKDIPQLKLNARLRKFQAVFINVICSFVNGEYTFYDSEIDYQKIM